MTDVEKAINANNKLSIIGKEPLYLILDGKVYLDVNKIHTENVKVNKFVYGIISSRYTCNPDYDIGIDNIDTHYIKSIEFGDNIKDIKDSTFYSMTSLSKISDLDKVESLNCYRLFSKCKSLKITPKLPDYVTKLEETFYMCNELEHITNLPKKCIKFDSTFSKCSSLKISPDLPICTVNIDGMFECCSKLEKAPIIHRNVESMVATFKECENLSGELVVNANNKNVYSNSTDFLYRSAINSKLILTGECNFLDRLLASTNDKYNIEIKR